MDTVLENLRRRNKKRQERRRFFKTVKRNMHCIQNTTYPLDAEKIGDT